MNDWLDIELFGEVKGMPLIAANLCGSLLHRLVRRTTIDICLHVEHETSFPLLHIRIVRFFVICRHGSNTLKVVVQRTAIMVRFLHVDATLGRL